MVDDKTDWIELQKSPAVEPLNRSLLFAIHKAYDTTTLSFFQGSHAIREARSCHKLCILLYAEMLGLPTLYVSYQEQDSL